MKAPSDDVKKNIFDELARLQGVEVRAVTSGWARWRGENFFAHIERRTPALHVKLSRASRGRASQEKNISSNKFFQEKGWLAISLRSARDIRSALRWAFVAYQETSPPKADAPLAHKI